MGKYSAKQLAGFIVPSVVGILLFMIPIQYNGSWTITIKIVADIIGGAMADFLPLLCVVIVTLSAVLGVASLRHPSFITTYPIIDSTFTTTPVWAIIRVVGAVFIWLVYLGVFADGDPQGPFAQAIHAITCADAGGHILGSKIPVNLLELFVLFLERTIISLIIVAPISALIF